MSLTVCPQPKTVSKREIEAVESRAAEDRIRAPAFYCVEVSDTCAESSRWAVSSLTIIAITSPDGILYSKVAPAGLLQGHLKRKCTACKT